MQVCMQNPKRVAFDENVEAISKNDPPTITAAKFHSQPIPTGVGFEEAVAAGKFPKQQLRNSRIDNLKDERFSSFKTWSGKLERQISNLRGKPTTEASVNTPRTENVPVDRYFDALEGPELDILRVCSDV